MSKLETSAANFSWFAYSALHSNAFEKAAWDPEAAQAEVLNKIVSSNANSSFGKEHDFQSIHDAASFQSHLLIRNYEDFEPYIDQIAKGKQSVLTSEPVTHFAKTSGSTTAYKLIPYTASLVKEFQEGIDPWISRLFRQNPVLLFGKSYWSTTPVGDEKHFTPGGIPIGFDDEKAYFSPFTQWVLDKTMVGPSALAQIKDMEEFKYTSSRLLLQERDLSWISIWNPSFLALVLDPLTNQKDSLIADIADGSLKGAVNLEDSIREIVLSKCHKDPKRASQLERIFEAGSDDQQTVYERIWPDLTFISSWAHGQAARAVPQLKEMFPKALIQPKGLLATEGFVSFPFKENLSALSLRSHFFEFEGEAGLKLAHQLQIGERYSVVLTTAGGLYRYRLNDMIEVGDFYKKCPLIEFVGRQSKVVDVRGEKLNEDFVSKTVQEIFDQNQLDPAFWMLAPEFSEVGSPFYTLFLKLKENQLGEQNLKQIRDQIEKAIRKSYHYDYCRRLGQLKSLGLFLIDPQMDAQKAYLETCTNLGQRLGDIKSTNLHSFGHWSGNFKGKFI